MEINIQYAAQSMPFCRKDLFTDVVHNKVYGDISQVWHFQGHLLITTNDGRKLFTFDCRPVDEQHILHSKCLDIPVLSTPLIDVLMLSPYLLALIDTAGHVMFWRFTAQFSWSSEGSTQICTSSGAEIISITYLPGCNTLVWCEIQPVKSSSITLQSTYCICKRQLCSDLDTQKIIEQSQTSVFIWSCPPSDVQSISSNVLFITTQFNSEQVTVHLVFDFVNKHLSLLIGEECINCPEVFPQEVLDFHEIVVNTLPVVMQTSPGQGDLGVRSDSTLKQAAMLSSSGELELYTCITDSGMTTLSKKKITLTCEGGQTYKVHTKHWFLNRGHVGVLCDNTVQIFRVNNGKLVCKSTHGNIRNVQKVIKSSSPIFLTWFLTSEELFSLQGIETKNKEMYTSADSLSDDHLLQTDIMRLVRLHELRMSESNQTLMKELEQLKRRWTEAKNKSHHSLIFSLIAPYLEEYWRLESLSQSLVDTSKQPVTKADVNSADHMVKTLMEIKSFSKTARHAKLLWLSEVHPQELLNFLCQGITIESAEVLENEVKKWQSVLGMDGSNLLTFEFVCRLLFHLMPQKLLNFVKCAESVSEQTVGVSAFVRKKHSLIYYKTAWECLPHCEASCDSKTAASVKAALILASESENCVERALKCLLQHGLWSEAVELVKGQAKNDEGLPAYLHITIKTLAENQVLSDYAVDLFSVMPSWKSFLSFSQLATERSEVRQQQLSNLAKDVFFNEGPGIQLGDVRPYLLKLISE